MAMKQMLIKRGNKIDLPELEVGELAFCTDTEELYIGGENGNKLINSGGLEGEIEELLLHFYACQEFTFTHFIPAYRVKKASVNILITPNETADYIVYKAFDCSGQVELPVGVWFNYKVDDSAGSLESATIWIDGIEHIISTKGKPSSFIIERFEDENGNLTCADVYVKQVVLK